MESFVRSRTLTVRHGPRRDLLSVALIFPGLAGILSALLLAFSPRHFTSAYIAENVLFVVVLALGLVTFFHLTHVSEETVLAPSGIVRWRRLTGYSNRIAWDQLNPTPVGFFSFGFVTFKWRSSRPIDPLDARLLLRFTVDPVQARAILQYPSCPRAPLPARLLRVMGVPAGWEANRAAGANHESLPLSGAPSSDEEAESRTMWIRDVHRSVQVFRIEGAVFLALAITITILAVYVPAEGVVVLVAPILVVIGIFMWLIASRQRKAIHNFGVGNR
jgi:hypothetical protein